MFKVRVRDFQSIEDATIEVDGFTVVTGPNNSGKSALMRAVRGAFQNTRGTGFVRYEKPRAVVDVEFSDGNKLKWSKGKAKKDKPTYILNDGSPIHPGQHVPDEVRDLGIQPIQAGGRDIWPQFAPQFTGQIFLLDQPGSVLAEAVADVERVSQLNGALKLSESDRRAAGSTLKVRMADRENLKADLERFDGLDDLDSEVQSIEKGLQSVIVVGKAVEGLSDLRDRLNEATRGVEALAGIEDIEVPTDEPFDVLGGLLEDVGELRSIKDRKEEIDQRVSHLSVVEGVEVSDDEPFTNLSAILNEATELRSLKARRDEVEQRVEHLAGIEDIEVDLDGKAAGRYLDALGVLFDLSTRHKASTNGVFDLEESLALEKVSLETAEKAVTALFDELGVCPFCESELGDGHEH